MTNPFSHRIRKAAMAAGTIAFLGLTSPAYANDVVALKHALYGAGYDIENVNPELDSNTRAELEKFQRDQGLEVTGLLDEATERALGMTAVQPVASAAGQAGAGAAPAAEESATAATESEPEEEEEDSGWSLW
ncbi:MAG: peptidoglycan-binding protein [Marinobacter sp.]|uniref:peptidoglycan-binding domain-containing protein n=1 Tax=Marinobacter TaxID=2742 RepID=UPI001108C28A|nr:MULTISPECIES: peptidoglycan-binding domain-containing protein [Marinobacter]MDX5335572.1 peptidoglycan-binding protein [Marinobacter sp.]MDX5386444.1 peptidoglycan-binding protein [Marinobacter sp.]MDX5440646.1 peptidoglycan-binding protein [Alteromonadaceae bacterium]MDX5471913.1 peptidoglycan-binding protein [Marinobacter sp.]